MVERQEVEVVDVVFVHLLDALATLVLVDEVANVLDDELALADVFHRHQTEARSSVELVPLRLLVELLHEALILTTIFCKDMQRFTTPSHTFL